LTFPTPLCTRCTTSSASDTGTATFVPTQQVQPPATATWTQTGDQCVVHALCCDQSFSFVNICPSESCPQEPESDNITPSATTPVSTDCFTVFTLPGIASTHRLGAYTSQVASQAGSAAAPSIFTPTPPSWRIVEGFLYFWPGCCAWAGNIGIRTPVCGICFPHTDSPRSGSTYGDVINPPESSNPHNGGPAGWEVTDNVVTFFPHCCPTSPSVPVTLPCTHEPAVAAIQDTRPRGPTSLLTSAPQCDCQRTHTHTHTPSISAAPTF